MEVGPDLTGKLCSLANAALQEHHHQTIRTAKSVAALFPLSRIARSFKSSVTSDVHADASSACALFDIAPFSSISSAQTSPTRAGPLRDPSPINGLLTRSNRFFNGVLDCPNQALFASLSSRSLVGALGVVLRASVVSINGQRTIQGIKLDGSQAKRLDDAQIRAVFDDIDRNADGFIDKDEFVALLQQMGLPTNNHYLTDLMAQYTDAKGDTHVPFENFSRYVMKQSAKMWRAFRELDAENNGFITESGLLAALQSMGLPAKADDSFKMIQLLDNTATSTVSYKEFCRFACLLPSAQLENDNVAFCWVDSADYTDGVEFRLSMTPAKQTAQRLLAGGVAGVLSRTMVAPLERLRTIMMASAQPLSMAQCVRSMWQDGGLGGMFKGNMATVLKVLPASAVQFAAYDGVKDLLRAMRPAGEGPRSENLERLLAGSTAGAASCLVTYPLETIRTMMSMPGCVSGNFAQVTTQALQQYGVRGLYSGFSSSIVSEMIGTGLGFMAYELGQQAWERTHGCKPSAKEKGIVGACSAMVVMTATMPLELIMRRMQIAGTAAGAAFQYRNTWHALRVITAQEGFATFYRGSLFAYAKVVPSIGAMYMLYEAVSAAMAIGGLRRYDQDRALLKERKAAKEQRMQAQAVSEAAGTASPEFIVRTHGLGDGAGLLMSQPLEPAV